MELLKPPSKPGLIYHTLYIHTATVQAISADRDYLGSEQSHLTSRHLDESHSRSLSD